MRGSDVGHVYCCGARADHSMGECTARAQCHPRVLTPHDIVKYYYQYKAARYSVSSPYRRRACRVAPGVLPRRPRALCAGSSRGERLRGLRGRRLSRTAFRVLRLLGAKYVACSGPPGQAVGRLLDEVSAARGVRVARSVQGAQYTAQRRPCGGLVAAAQCQVVPCCQARRAAVSREGEGSVACYAAKGALHRALRRRGWTSSLHRRLLFAPCLLPWA